MHTPVALLQQLGLSEAETSVLLAFVEGAATPADAVRRTGLKRPTVYYLTQRLLQRGLLHRTGRDRGARLAVNLDGMRTAADERVRRAERAAKDVGAWIGAMQTATGAGEMPAVEFYEGEKAVKRLISETLYVRSGRKDTIAPHHNFFRSVSEDFVWEYVTERNRRGVKTRHLWEAAIDQKTYRAYYGASAEVRILPAVMKGRFKTTVFLLDDKVAYISSRKNAYALLVRSKEHFELMSAMFDGLWSASTPHPKK